MSDNIACDCPLCSQAFVSADGSTPVEFLADGIIKLYAQMQTKDRLPCPRCGCSRMAISVFKNALSRHAEIYVCDVCGNDEAVRVFKGQVLPITEWAVVVEILRIYEAERV